VGTITGLEDVEKNISCLCRDLKPSSPHPFSIPTALFRKEYVRLHVLGIANSHFY
jgi:hypothetical protein